MDSPTSLLGVLLPKAAGASAQGPLHLEPHRGAPRRSTSHGGPGQRGDPSDRTSVLAPGRAVHPAEKPGLLLVSSPDPTQVGSYFAIDGGEVVIGRVSEADIRVNDPGISRSHVRISRGPAGEFVAQDLGTTNGTWVNGMGVQSAVLAEGDRLQIGSSTEFLFGVRREGTEAEVRLRQALSTSGAGTWEWLPATDTLGLHGGIVRSLGRETDCTEPRAKDPWAHVHPGDREALRARMASALQQAGTFQAEVRLLRRDGGVAWVALTGEPFRDRDGRPVRLAGALLDVTERRRADAELRRHSLLFDSLADAVVVVGSDGTILDWNAGAGRAFGWSKAEALGRSLGALLLPRDEARLDGAVVACARDGRRRADELTLQGKSGAEVPVELAAVPLVSQEEERIACVAVFRDLGERRRLEARLQAAERLASLGTLAAGVAHEINNPLAFMLANLDFVTQHLAQLASGLGPLQAEVTSALGDCSTGAQRIATIVRDLQTFGRARSESNTAIDPNQALEFALKMAASRMRRCATVLTELAPVPPVLASEPRLGQVFLNLLVNASQSFGPGRDGGNTIRVRSRHDAAARRVVVEVSDNGTGMAPEVQARIFEPFFTTKDPGEGTGLGLFVCQGIITELGGELTVESQEGRGTTFRVSLPVPVTAPRAAPARPRVLVVDDEQLLGSALKRYFSGRFEVEAVTDPHQALERVRSGERFLLALVDLHLPKMSGQDFLAELRASSPELARRAVVVTGGPVDQALASFKGQEPPIILPKPIDLARVAALVDAAAGGEPP